MRWFLLLLLGAIGCRSALIGDDYSYGEFFGVSPGSGKHWRAALNRPARNVTALSLGAAAALLQIDDVDDRWQREIARQDWMPGSAMDASDVGSALLPAIGLLGPLLIPPHRARGIDRRRYFATAGYAILANLSLQFVVKETVGRMRPLGGSHSSFYSGHTTAAFTGAQLIQRFYGRRAGIPAYVLAATVAWNRVEGNRHFPADVLVGAAAGIFVTDLIYEKNFGPHGLYAGSHEVELVPILTAAERGLALRWSW